MTTAKPSAPPDRLGRLLPLLLVPIAAGIWLASRAAYYEGFAESLGIPDSLSVIPNISTSSAIFEFTAIFVGLNGLIVFAQAFGLVKLAKYPVVGRLIATLVMTTLLGLGGLMVLLKQWPNPFGTGFGILLLGLCLLFLWLIWLQPPISNGEEESRVSVAKIMDDDEPWDLTNLILSLGGRSAGLVLMAFILVPWAGYFLGMYVGGERTEWLVVESPEIPGDAASETWIVLGEKGDHILVAPTENNIIINSYRLIGSTSATFHRKKLGELEPQDIPRGEKD